MRVLYCKSNKYTYRKINFQTNIVFTLAQLQILHDVILFCFQLHSLTIECFVSKKLQYKVLCMYAIIYTQSQCQ